MRYPCSSDPDLWFSEDEADKAKAKDACLDCPLMLTCRQEAPLNEFGIWGGEEGSLVVEPLSEPDALYLHSLNPRMERRDWRVEEALRLTRDGKSAREIAMQLRVSERTVVRYRSDAA